MCFSCHRTRRRPGVTVGVPPACWSQLDGHNMILKHCTFDCGVVRHCVWSSGGALATWRAGGGRRRRLLDLKTRRSEVDRVTRGAFSLPDLLSWVTRSTHLLFTLRSSWRHRQSPGVAWASPEDQTQSLTSPGCPRIILGPSGRLGSHLRRPWVACGSCGKKNTLFIYEK